ncbi:MAG: hypothetical protein Q4C42_00335 [Clostridia bacterium]|nr:hypothetical protein [Clostridia bacterium]
MKNSNNNKMTVMVIVGIIAVLAITGSLTFFGTKSSKTDEPNLKPEDKIAEDFEVMDDEAEYEDNQTYTTEKWPVNIFPDIPVFEADSYEVIDLGKNISIICSEKEYDNLDGYITELTELGGEICIDEMYFTLISLGDVEIQIFRDKTAPRITFAGEDAVDISEMGFDDFPLPNDGRIINAEYIPDETDRLYLTTRNMNFENAKAYCTKLVMEGWTEHEPASRAEKPEAFLAEYRNGNNSILVDYHTGSSDMTIILESSEGVTETPETVIYRNPDTGEYYRYTEEGFRTPVDINAYEEGTYILNEDDENMPRG